MIRHTIKRILISIPVLIGVVLITFIMLRVVPGNPVTTMMGEHVNQDVIEKVSEELGLNDPLYVQFFKYIGNAVRGNFGTSYKMNRDVSRIILEAFPNTVRLAIMSALFACVMGIVTGVAAAISKSRFLDKLFMGTALLGVSMPVFMVAFALQYIFAFKLGWFPISGYEGIRNMILPAVVLGWNSAGSIARMVRSNLIEVMQEDYVDTARAKGLAEGRIVIFHALKNTMLPVVTVIAIQVSSLFSGAVITESIFGIPGIGRLAVTAIENRDVPLLQGTILFSTVIVILGNLLADLLYSVLDPRIRKES